jgi:hypothetical protein
MTDEEMTSAIDRIARTADGLMLYRYFQHVAMSDDPGTGVGALLKFSGRRSFARELMALMGKGVDESGGSRRPTEQPVVFAGRKPVVGERRGSAERRVKPYDDPA